MSKIVIVGGTGFVGRTLVHMLVSAGHRVDVLSRNRERQRELLIYPAVRVISTDVYDPKALARAFRGADAVVNLVGILNEFGNSGRGFEKAHVSLTRTIVDACGEAGVSRLIQMSALNAGAGQSHYLRTRGQAEDVVKQSSLDWTLIRPSVARSVRARSLSAKVVSTVSWAMPRSFASLAVSPTWASSGSM